MTFREQIPLLLDVSRENPQQAEGAIHLELVHHNIPSVGNLYLLRICSIDVY